MVVLSRWAVVVTASWPSANSVSSSSSPSPPPPATSTNPTAPTRTTTAAAAARNGARRDRRAARSGASAVTDGQLAGVEAVHRRFVGRWWPPARAGSAIARSRSAQNDGPCSGTGRSCRARATTSSGVVPGSWSLTVRHPLRRGAGASWPGPARGGTPRCPGATSRSRAAVWLSSPSPSTITTVIRWSSGSAASARRVASATATTRSGPATSEGRSHDGVGGVDGVGSPLRPPELVDARVVDDAVEPRLRGGRRGGRCRAPGRPGCRRPASRRPCGGGRRRAACRRGRGGGRRGGGRPR